MKSNSIFLFLLIMLTAGNVFGEERLPVFSIRCERENAVQYRKGETARFQFHLQESSGKAMEGYPIQYTAYVDGTGVLKGKVTSGKQPVTVGIKQDAPGFCSVIGYPLQKDGTPFLNEKKEPIYAGCGAGFSLEEIRQGYPEPKDFDVFWKQNLKELAAVPLRVKWKKINLRTWKNGEEQFYADKVNVYEVTISCCGTKPVTGYVAYPIGAVAKSLPAIVVYQSYGVFSAEIPFHYGKRGLAFSVNAHGLENGREAAYYQKIQQGSLKEYYRIGNTDRRKYYFREMFLRAFRALEFVKGRPEWNGRDLIVTGYSQGGGQALAAAGLDPDVSLCVVFCPALCDLGGILANRRSGWGIPPVNLGKNKSAAVPPILRETAYMDAANFARRIKGTVCFSAGDYDLACPPSSVYTAYRNVPGKKSFELSPCSGHFSINREGLTAIRNILFRKKTFMESLFERFREKGK